MGHAAGNRLAGKRILITGGGTGIGRSCAEFFTAQGARVAVAGRQAEPLRETAEAINQERGSGTAVAILGDVSREDDAERIVREAVEDLDGLDGLVNNAGVFEPGGLFDASSEQLARVFDVNVRGALLMAQAAARRMIERGEGGSILNISSTLGSRPNKGCTVYSASKAALDNFTAAWALELAPHQIRVNGIAPAAVDTPIHHPDPEKRRESLERMGPMHPLGRVGRPEEIAWAAAYFMSDESAWTTGAILDVDGGINARNV
ncbi:SDR family oxidoreductase [Candidatus Sumerlaeota bacterium]|nr:SDR family oxidoreductase [Candidatus Sumerlaeota bacterium]